MNVESYHNISITTSTTSFVRLVAFLGMLCALIPATARAQITPGSMNVHWDEGAADCSKSTQPRLQVHPYNGRTFILRENLCATFEAPFMYLLVGIGESAADRYRRRCGSETDATGKDCSGLAAGGWGCEAAAARRAYAPAL